MKVLILWSGGVESTSLLKQYLSETQDEIFAHYIRMVNPEGRLQSENQAVIELFPLLSKIRSFNLSFSDISICGGKALPNDIKVIGPIGVIAMEYHGCELMMTSYSQEDYFARSFLDGVSITLPRPSDDHRYYWNERRKLIAAVAGKDVHPYHHSYDWTKKQHMDYLGDLLQHTHSCRRPVTGKLCGKCHSCIERNA